MEKVLILANDVKTILQFRTELVIRLVSDGYDVTVSVPEDDRIIEIEELGAKVVKTQVSRHGTNPFQDLKLLSNYKKLIKQIKPDIVFTFTIKPNIYGGMACKKFKVPCVANVTGLGAAGEKGVLQKLMLWLYKQGVKKDKCVFFQNQANLDFFVSRKIVRGRVELLPGSGVNLEKFPLVDYPTEDKTEIVFVGRIIKDKGVNELATVAKDLVDKEDLHFTIVGDVEFGEVNPFDGLVNVSCVGFHKDVRPFLKDAHAIVLPSYHEGMANVLLEAASSGKVILASNISGCMETFDEGVSGFGFDAKDVESLKQTILRFADLSLQDKKQMGLMGRKKVEEQFDRQIVVEKYVDQIKNLNA